MVRADYTDRKTAQAAVQRLLLDGISVMGVIFNYWDPTINDLYSYPATTRISREHKRDFRAATRRHRVSRSR